MSDTNVPTPSPAPSSPTTPESVQATDYESLRNIIKSEVSNILTGEKLTNVLAGWVISLDPVTIKLLDGSDVQPILKNSELTPVVGQKVSLTHTVNGFIINNHIHGVSTEVPVNVHDHSGVYSPMGHTHSGTYATTSHTHTPNVGRFYSASAQSIAHNTEVRITIDATLASNIGVVGTAGRLTLLNSGTYYFGGQLSFDANGTGFRWISIVKNDTDTLANTTVQANSALATVVNVSVLVTASSGDTISIWGRQNSGGSLAMQFADGYAGRLSCRMYGILL